jgi:hypothetical protein
MSNVICIKDVYAHDNNKLLKKDVIYETDIISDKGVVFRCPGDIIYFPFENTSHLNCVIFSDIEGCYITLAEWREQQINSILDD